MWRRAAALTSCKGLIAAATRASIGTEPISSANSKYTVAWAVQGYSQKVVESNIDQAGEYTTSQQ